MQGSQRPYVHGYHARESNRLQAQAGSVVELLHGDTRFAAGTLVLEAGCGTGAQSVTLARNSPGARLISFDRSWRSLGEARSRLATAQSPSVELMQADLFALPFRAHAFDHVFVCFVLEHLDEPAEALRALRRCLKPGGTITVFEGDHGPTSFHPPSAAARRAIECQVELQRRAGGNACIGRELYPLLVAAGFADARVSPRIVYVDSSRPDLADGFTKRTFIAMIAGVRDAAVAAGIIDAETFDAGIRDLNRTTEDDGVFFYSFFKGIAVAP